MSYEVSPISIAGSIRNDLMGVHGFSLVKEFIQNADDARATRFAIGLSQGIRGAEHPLLADPAVFIVNDGEFTPNDAKAIRQLNVSGKASQRGTIGKFGLGMKSIFSLGEAFFYLAATQDGFTQRYPGASVMSPWIIPGDRRRDSDELYDGERPEWNDFSSWDRQLISAELRAQGVFEGFTIWVPLRRQAHCTVGDETIAIFNSFYDSKKPTEIFDPKLEGWLVGLWPMLRHLRHMEIYRDEGVSRLTLSGTSSIRAYPSATGEPLPREPRQFRGEICSSEGWPYAGIEGAHHILEGLTNHENWPKIMESGLAGDKMVKDKSLPHHAAVFAVVPNAAEQGRLEIGWSVFLPVDSKVEKIGLAGGSSVALTLHGYFFLTPDRKAILGWQDVGSAASDEGLDNETKVMQFWNARLARGGTLPAVLPALEHFAHTVNDTLLVRQVTAGLREAALYQQFKPEICRDYQWVRRQLAEISSWRLERTNDQALELPKGRTAFDVFPSLAKLSARRILVFAGDPSLTLAEPLAHWPSDLVVALLDSVAAEQVFRDASQLSYLNAFLAQQAEATITGLSRQLVLLFQRGLRALDKREQEALRPELMTFLEHIPASAKLGLPASLPADLSEALLELELTLALVPESLGGSSHQQTLIATADGIKLLSTLEGKVAASSFIETVLDRSRNRDALLDHTKTLRLFKVDNLALESRVGMVSREDLRNHGERRLLFDAQQNQYTMARELQAALAADELWLIEKGLAALAGLEVRPCDKGACNQLLGTKVGLTTDPAKRLDLVERLRVPHINPAFDERAVLRYLLHAVPERFGAEGTLFYPVRDQQRWGELAQRLLSAVEGSWRWLGNDFADLSMRFNQTFMEAYGIASPNHDSVAELVRQAVAQATFPALGEADCDFLLEKLDDLELLRQLPIHETLAGARSPLTANTFLEGSLHKTWEGSPDLIADLTFIKKHPRLKYKQELLGLQELQPYDVVNHALSMEQPSRFWRDIAAMLPHIASTAVSDALRQTPWLPSNRGAPVAPANVVYLPALEETLRRLGVASHRTVARASELPEEVLAHPAFPSMPSKVLPAREAALAMLGEVLAEDPRFLVGNLPMDSLPAWQQAFRGEGQVMPVAPLLERLAETAEHLWGALAQAVELPRLKAALAYLRHRHEGERAKELREVVGQVHNHYLRLAVRASGWSLEGAGIRLLNRAGEWKAPEELCSGQDGVDLAFLLDKEQARILGITVEAEVLEGQVAPSIRVLPKTSAEWSRVGSLLADSAAKLESHFKKWRPHVRDELIGGFLSVLGDDPKMRELAQTFLGSSFTTDKVRAGFDIEGYDKFSLPDKIASYRFVLEVVNPESFVVTNLLGGTLRVHAPVNPEHLFAGQIEYQNVDGIYYGGAKLLDIPPEREDTRLDEVLRESVRVLFANAYNHKQTNLEGMWDKLGQSEQVNLRVAQHLIVDSAYSYLKAQLGVKDGPLAKVFKAWDDASFGVAQEEILGGAGEKTSAARKQAAKAQLQELLTNDAQAQASVLRALRGKLSGYQYHLTSIPFELFQNADDALVELEHLNELPQQHAFRIVINPEGLNFMHWGRMINHSPHGRVADFHRDLEKMLTLNASDKGGEVTGKFGLGFKSVFILTDRPQVVSGDLGFEVLGGVYPVTLSPEAFARLRGQLTDHGSRMGTIIHLPANRDQAAQSLERFRALAPYMLPFSRAANHITLNTKLGDGDTQLEEWQWQEQPVESVPGASHGRVAGHSLLRLRAGDVSVLLALGSSGFTPVPEDLPTLWVTAPTEEYACLGFLLNGPFELDVGRAQLARSSTANRELIEHAAAALEDTLGYLVRLDPETLRAQLGLGETSAFEVWSSFFKVLTQGFSSAAERPPAMQLAHQLLWGEDGPATKLYDRTPILPTGMSGTYGGLTSLSALHWHVGGTLEDQALFEQVMALPLAKEIAERGAIVSRDVWERLQAVGVEPTAQRLDLSRLLKSALMEQGRVTPSVANQLGSIITSEQLYDKRLQAELSEIRNVLAGARFLGNDNQYHPARELLAFDAEDEDSDESMRAAFAPYGRLLREDYDPAGVAFFKACRVRLDAGVEDLAEWVLKAEAEKQLAALRYLTKGELGRSVCDVLTSKLAGTWLESLRQDPNGPPLDRLTNKDVMMLRLLLGLLVPDGDATEEEEAQEPLELASYDPKELLEYVYERWQEEKEDLLEQHERITYPEPLRLSATYDPDCMDQRQNWLTLLILGALMSMGRTQSQQNREFLRRCIDRGWMDVFMDPNPDRGRWMGVLEDYFSESAESWAEEEYRHWMSQFVTIYQLSRWLDDYVELILGLNLARSPEDVAGVWAPRTAASFSGSGISAPAIEKALRLGRHFVIRELVRRGVLTNRLLYRYCFTPSRRIREVFALLGCSVGSGGIHDAKTIFEFVERHLGSQRATFDLGFDLPFWAELYE